MAYGYLSESTQRELSNEYQHDRVSMVFINLCILVHWTKVALALEGSGTDISTSPLAPASDFLKKGLSGKSNLVFTCPNGQVDFLNIKHNYLNSKWPKYPEICNKLKRKWFSNLQIHDKQNMPFLHML